jgi:hypothetical protein
MALGWRVRRGRRRVIELPQPARDYKDHKMADLREIDFSLRSVLPDAVNVASAERRGYDDQWPPS